MKIDCKNIGLLVFTMLLCRELNAVNEKDPNSRSSSPTSSDRPSSPTSTESSDFSTEPKDFRPKSPVFIDSGTEDEVSGKQIDELERLYNKSDLGTSLLSYEDFKSLSPTEQVKILRTSKQEGSKTIGEGSQELIDKISATMTPDEKKDIELIKDPENDGKMIMRQEMGDRGLKEKLPKNYDNLSHEVQLLELDKIIAPLKGFGFLSPSPEQQAIIRAVNREQKKVNINESEVLTKQKTALETLSKDYSPGNLFKNYSISSYADLKGAVRTNFLDTVKSAYSDKTLYQKLLDMYKNMDIADGINEKKYPEIIENKKAIREQIREIVLKIRVMDIEKEQVNVDAKLRKTFNGQKGWGVLQSVRSVVNTIKENVQQSVAKIAPQSVDKIEPIKPLTISEVITTRQQQAQKLEEQKKQEPVERKKMQQRLQQQEQNFQQWQKEIQGKTLENQQTSPQVQQSKKRQTIDQENLKLRQLSQYN